MLWLSNTSGKKDAVLTMSFIGFLVVVGKVLLSGATITVMDKTIGFGSIDGTVIAAILTPTLGAYISRRYTDAKFAAPADK